MRRIRIPHAAAATVLALAVGVGSAAAAGAANVVDISVPGNALHYNQKTFNAAAGLVRFNFTNNSAAPHNVSLEHNGEFEYGATLTIKKGITTSFLTLAKGTYHLYSSVGKDEDKGMSATLVVK